MRMLAAHHRKTLWVYWALIFLGFWMMAAPSAFGYGQDFVSPAGGRDLRMPPDLRAAILSWNDIFCGVLLVVFGVRALRPNRPVSLWLACLTGIWLSAAPLIFWAPQAVIYYNDTFVGMLVVALTILIPGMPNMIRYMKTGPMVPPGWSYNPSSWTQRSIMAALGFAGWMVSRYLAAFQMGYIDTVWDPFFGGGSRAVLVSEMSEAWPVSDGGLGAFSYTLEFLMVWMGSQARWRTMPWMVTLFGFLVIPLGLVHIFLVISQPVLVGEWCALCLLAAAIMLPMIPLEVDEVIAMFQFLKRAQKHEGQSLWQAFWKGGTLREPEGVDKTMEIEKFPDHPKEVFIGSVSGMSFPWTLTASTVLGVWMMFVPAVFGSAKPMADLGHLAGALVVTVSVIAMGEVVRSFRFLNIVLAGVIMVMPLFIPGASGAEIFHNVLAGLTLIYMTIPRGKVLYSYGTWDRNIV